jgi:microsomal epoxide hydrolase
MKKYDLFHRRTTTSNFKFLMIKRLQITCVTISLIFITIHQMVAQDINRYFLTSDSVRIHYTDIGTGEVIIFVPGLSCPLEIWKHQVDFFKSKYRVIAMDPRSHGRSEITTKGLYLERMGQDILDLIQYIGQKPLTIVGHSYGVWEILSLLEQFGVEVASSVVLVDNRMERQVTVESTKNAMKSWSARQKNPVEATEGLFRNCFANQPSEEFLQTLIDLSLNMPGSLFFAIGANGLLVDRDWWQVLEKATIPILYTYARERYTESANKMKSQIPNAKVEHFPGAGHCLMVDEPDRFNRILESFLLSVTCQ